MNTKELVESDFLKVKYDFIEYYVGMAKMVVYWHVKALGFKVVAYAGPETGCADKCSYFIVKNNIKLVITSASQPSSYQIVSFVDLHGNGIKKIAVQIKDVTSFFKKAIKDGAIPVQFPQTISDSHGSVEMGSVKIFDDNEIVFVNYDNYNGLFMPGYESIDNNWSLNIEDSYLTEIDHIASALRINEIKLWETYINNIFNSKTVECFDERKENGKDSKIGMFLKVLQTKGGEINNVLVEPDQHKNTQIQLFIEQNYGSGIQHIAFSSSNIFKSVDILRKNGVRFTSYPTSYYNSLKKKHPELDVQKFKKYGVLCDVVGDSLLFQVFTTPIGDRATFFYEIVQRVNQYDGFGLDNIHALFEALEEEIMK